MRFNPFSKLSKSYSSAEALARKATNEDLFGPATKDLIELTALSYKPKACLKILGILAYRFQQSDRHWRQKSKSLTVLQYFLLNGSPQCWDWLVAHKMMLSTLLDFKYLDSSNNDQGRSVRDKANALLLIVNDPSRLDETRENYLKQRENVRNSIGNGRPSSHCRNTLEMMRESIFDDPDMSDLNGAFRARSPEPVVIDSTTSPLADPEPGRTRALDVITEES